ncbi:ABC transporter family substrate-binding protein [Streptomyces sp. ME02-8801-2C]|uniref:ABC transporter family substrate-binding protein n=1 Tax=Streptomyces sp. ME02-8801-2C TaxID=3028680 RepID=UPI0029BBDB10|nr:ABC transporter family substrate-binding protein [Streptomyces sp. ME02-8801-2C]MDX3458168.1 ABC transporter family substrate-binding protein [Streptomyces sp. ME02-8801-2C]
MSHHGVGLRAVTRSVAFLTAGVLAVPLLTACGGDQDEESKPLAGQDIAPADRARLADGGTLRWAVDALPETLNTFQADADATTTRVAQAVLPSMYRLDANGRAKRNADFLESAKVVEREPKQVVLYKLHQQAVWSDGREIGAADFAAQWRALSGRDSAYWTARNAGYDRIEKVQRGANDLEVKVTFSRPYADWKSLFSPLYPKEVMGTPDSFNDGARRRLKLTAGAFTLKKVAKADGDVVLVRNPRWWGQTPRLDKLVLRAVPRDKRAEALAAGKVDVAEVDPAQAERIVLASRGKSKPLQGPGARREQREATAGYAEQQQSLSAFEVRKSLEPAYTQLALNGADGPLADERVRRAVARALDRKEIAGLVLKPLGLPAVPVGSHLALSGQAAYADNSGALGGEDTDEAEALLADAGWVHGGPIKKPKEKDGEKVAGGEGRKAVGKSPTPKASAKPGKAGDDSKVGADDDGTYVVGDDDKPYGEPVREDHQAPRDSQRGRGKTSLAQEGEQPEQGGAPAGAYAPKGTPAPAGAAGALAKDGKPLTLRFVLPSGPGSATLRAVGERIARMLDRVGIRTAVTKVSDDSYFKDHIANGQYDLALYSWPASAFPATDARPIYAKPVPAADGSLNVEQNYTRVGTDQVDQLFDQAIATLDEGKSAKLVRKADARIWAAGGSIPLFQRPQLTAVRKNVANVGAFGFQTPHYEDMGFLKKGVTPGSKASHRP